MLLKVNGIPRVCEGLSDPNNCQRVVEVCGPDAHPDWCALGIVGKTLVSPEQHIKVLRGWWGLSKDVYHGGMRLGHRVTHSFVKDLVNNVSGTPGEVGPTGHFIAHLMGLE